MNQVELSSEQAKEYLKAALVERERIVEVDDKSSLIKMAAQERYHSRWKEILIPYKEYFNGNDYKALVSNAQKPSLFDWLITAGLARKKSYYLIADSICDRVASALESKGITGHGVRIKGERTLISYFTSDFSCQINHDFSIRYHIPHREYNVGDTSLAYQLIEVDRNMDRLEAIVKHGPATVDVDWLVKLNEYHGAGNE